MAKEIEASFAKGRFSSMLLAARRGSIAGDPDGTLDAAVTEITTVI
jgi:hypothetical protein